MADLSLSTSPDLLYQVALPRYLHFSLTYRFKTPPQIGMIFKVPLRKQTTWGLVVGPLQKPLPATLRTQIKTIDDSTPHPIQLTVPYVEFLIHLSKYYHYPLGLIFKMVCPNPILKKIRPPDFSKTAQQSHLAQLNAEQKEIFESISNNFKQRKPEHHLIFGVTGSGKTEVYMHLAHKFLNQSKKVLLVVPEIALTPQLIGRFQKGTSHPIAVLHSGLTPAQHQKNWYTAFAPGPALVIGTRSALFHPLPNLGLMIMDEEHDGSFKQSDHLRYHARDVILFRAQKQSLPIVFGSATPSFECLYQSQLDKIKCHKLTHRFQDTPIPTIEILQNQKLQQPPTWISEALKQNIQKTLNKNKQVMLYLNRKGFAPFMTCTHCAQSLHCSQCDTTMTYYKKHNRCICHICGLRIPPPQKCKDCGSPFIVFRGLGTEALEEEVKKTFPKAKVLRIDRDNITTFKKLHTSLASIADHEVDIVIGTQMLAKGHDFPNLHMVGILNGDQSLNLPDFRAVEWTSQSLNQISGRAGRRESGEVYLQAFKPDHPLLRFITQESYETIFQHEMDKRKQFELPPYWQMARFIFNVKNLDSGLRKLQPLWKGLQSYNSDANQHIYPPTPCLREKISNVYRIQLLIKSKQHKALHQLIAIIRKWCDSQDIRSYVLDINPQQFL